MNQSASSPVPSASSINRAYAAMIFDGLCVAGGGVILPLLRARWQLSYDFSGTLLAVLSVGNLVSALLFGILPRFWGVRRTALIFISGLALGYLLLTATGLPALLLLGFLLIGLGKGSTMNHATVMIGNASHDRTRSVNLINALFAIGSLSSPILFLGMKELAFPMAPVAALSVSGLMVWLLFFSVREAGQAKAKTHNDDLSFLKDAHFWLSVLFLFCQQCAEISVTGWLVTYFKDQGILSGMLSELTVTVIWSAMLTGRLIIVFVLPANSRLRSLTLMSAAAFVSYLLLLSASSGIPALAALFLFGISMSGTYPTVIAQASASLSNASVGVLLPVGGIGAILMPYLTGAVAQRIGIRGGMMCSLAAIAVMLISAVLIRRCEKQAA